MPPATGSKPSLVRAEFGPTLPALLHQRLGIPPRATLLAVVLVLAIGATAVALRVAAHRKGELVYRAKPAFTLLYSRGALKRATPHPGELARLQARRGGLSLSVTVRPLRLASYGGIAAGALPLYAEHRIAGMRRRLAGFELSDEGKARVNGVPGYQLGFRTGDARLPSFGHDLLLVPDRPGARDGVVVSLRQTNPAGPLDDGDLKLIILVKKALHSFEFGTERT